MPIREFECLPCRRVFESLILKPSELEEVRCPDCGNDQLSLKFASGVTYAPIKNNGASVRPNMVRRGRSSK